MLNIKAIKMESLDKDTSWSPKYLSPKDYNWLNNLASRLGNLPILRRFKILDDLADYNFWGAMYLTAERWFEIITLRNLRFRLKLGWDYFKVGFNSWDFDSALALKEFMWKLERIAKYLEEHDRHTDVNECVKQIREFNRLAGRVLEDEYADELEKELEKKYGANIWYWAKNDFWNKGKGPFKNPNCGSMSLTRREKWTVKLDSEINKAERAKYKKAWKMREQEWKKALHILEKNFFKWWD